jgi:hypothetical protein
LLNIGPRSVANYDSPDYHNRQQVYDQVPPNITPPPYQSALGIQVRVDRIQLRLQPRIDRSDLLRQDVLAGLVLGTISQVIESYGKKRLCQRLGLRTIAVDRRLK